MFWHGSFWFGSHGGMGSVMAQRGNVWSGIVGQFGFGNVRRGTLRFGSARHGSQGTVRFGQSCSGEFCSGMAPCVMAVGASLVGSWFGQAWRGAAVEVGQVAAGRVVEWLDEERHGSYGVFRQVGSRLCLVSRGWIWQFRYGLLRIG